MVRIATTITVSLKTDGALQCSWLTALWPCWVGLALLTLISLGVVLLLGGTICWWIGKKCTWEEVACTFWLTWAVAGWSSSFGLALILISLANDGQLASSWQETSLSLPIFFLTTFLMWTHYQKSRIVVWWSLFFSREDPIPNAQVTPNVHSRPNSQQFTTLITSAPKILIRMSSTFFKPAPLPRFSRPQSVIDTRVFADAQGNEEKVLSVSTIEGENCGETVKTKACLVCYEAASNTVILPCGHGGICSNCAVLLWRDTGLCHLCRKKIDSVVEVREKEKGVMRVVKTTYQLSPFKQ